MNKELKKELFNIYDIVVFEDENGITQDCVCVIGKDKEVDKIVDMIECNNHSISIYENGSYKVWEKDGKGMPYYATNKKIIHLYTLKNDNRFYEIYPTNDYESIDNSSPSEALEETLRDIAYDLENDDNPFLRDRYYGLLDLKQALLKAQEPKHYLKWEDLEFNIDKQMMTVLLNGTKYTLIVGRNVHIDKLAFLRNGEINCYFLEADKQFFNDLHLERVEE